MKKKLISVISLLLSLSIFVSLAACGNKQTASDDDDFFNDKVDSVSQQPTNGAGSSQDSGKENTGGGKTWKQVIDGMPKSLRGTSITVYNWNPVSEYTGASSVIKKFEQATGISVNWQTENFDTYLSKLASMVAAGSSPDVVRMRTPLPAGTVSMQPMSVAEFDFSDAAWDSWVSDVYSINGKSYAVNLKNTNLSSPNMLLYNKSLISKYDLEDPYTLWKNGKWTYDKFVQICKDYMSESKADSACTYEDWSEFSYWFGVSGPVKFDGKSYSSAVGNSEFISATQKIADMKNTDRIICSWNHDDFNGGKLLFFNGSAVLARRMNSYFTTLKSNGQLLAVPGPTVSGKEEYQLFSEVEAYGIPKGAKNPKAVPYFLRYFLDGNNYDLSSFFCSEQALEVYNHCMKTQNRMWTTLYREQHSFYGDRPADTFISKLIDSTASQVSSILNSTASDIELRVKRYNQELQSIG